MTTKEAKAEAEAAEAKAEAAATNAAAADEVPNPGTAAPVGARSGEIMRYFEFEGLPDGSIERQVAAVVSNAAQEINAILVGASAEKSAGLRKLIEASDCFRRAAR